MELALVIASVAVAVSGKGSLPVVMEICAGGCQPLPPFDGDSTEKYISLGNGNKIRAVRRVNQSVVEIFVDIQG